MQALHESLLEVVGVFDDCARYGMIRSMINAGRRQGERAHQNTHGLEQAASKTRCMSINGHTPCARPHRAAGPKQLLHLCAALLGWPGTQLRCRLRAHTYVLWLVFCALCVAPADELNLRLNAISQRLTLSLQLIPIQKTKAMDKRLVSVCGCVCVLTHMG